MSNVINTTTAKSTLGNHMPPIVPVTRRTTQAPRPTAQVPVPTAQVPVPKAQVPFPTAKVPVPSAKVPVPSAKEVLNLSPLQPTVKIGKPYPPTTSAVPPEKTDPRLEPFTRAKHLYRPATGLHNLPGSRGSLRPPLGCEDCRGATKLSPRTPPSCLLLAGV